MVVRDNFEGKCCFLPWLLGSQSCEQAFWAVRSMNGVFSTVINFGMLGLYRRLHRLDIQCSLQAESHETGIKYPVGHKCCGDQSHEISEVKVTSYQRYCDDCINECVKKAECKAKESVELLGMRELLEKHKLWDAVPSKMEDEIDTDDSDEEGEGDNDMIPDEVSRDIFNQDEMTENLSDMQEDVNILSKNELITPQAAVKFSKNLKACKNSSISVYSKIPASKDINEALDEPKSLKRFSAFVEIKK